MFIFQVQFQLSTATPRGPAVEPALPEVGRGVAELMRVNKNLEETKSYLNSLNPEILKTFREFPESFNIPGFNKKLVAAEAHGNDIYTLRFLVTPEGDRKLDAATAGKILDDVINPQLTKIEQLRKDGWISSVNVHAELDKKGGMLITILSNAGVRAKLQDDSVIFIEDVLTPIGRKQAWEKVLKNVSLVDVYRPVTEPLEDQTLHHLRMLKTVYQGSKDTLMTSLVQGLIAATNLKKVDEILEYVEFGRSSADQSKFVPEVFRKQIEKVNEFSQYTPSLKEIRSRAVRTKDIELSPNANAFLRLEHQAQVFSGLVVDIADIELRESKRYALEKGGVNADPIKASEVVRSYFVEHSPSAYDFLENPKGLAGGIAIGRTNCSTRAIIAYEMFKAMNVKSGTEYLMAQENGQDVRGTQSHLVNWIELSDGKRRYFDFGIDSDKPYAFDSDKPIISRYLGGSEDPRITVRTKFSSTDAEIYGFILREPILKELRDFFAKFSKEKGNLAEFLKAHGEEIFSVQKITGYLRLQDKLLNTKYFDVWLDGSREKLLAAYSEFVR